MTIDFNGKKIQIPDAELEKSMKMLEISQNEAVQLWLEDNDFCENAEAEALTKKAKENHAVQHSAKSTKSRTATKRERKPDTEKEDIIHKLADFLTTNGFESVEITNKSKLIEFKIGENHYKLDLIRQRAQKKG